MTDYTRFSTNIPSLPHILHLNLDLAIGAGEWLDKYVKYAKAISPMTPSLFHESAGLWLASVVIARRLVLRMPFADIYPNLYVVWNAISTLPRKSTSMEIPRRIGFEHFPFLFAPNDTTPEAMISDMAGKEPPNLAEMTITDKVEWELERNYCAQRGWMLDEISGLLAGMGRDYNAGLLEALLRFYDCIPSFTRSTRNQGRIKIRNAYLSVLGASTPSALSPYLKSERLWNNGFWPRFAILTLEVDKPEWAEVQYVDQPQYLGQQLQNLFSKLPQSKWPDFPQALSVGLAKGVMDAWKAYNRAVSYDLLTPELDGKLFAAYGRLPTHALKIATILTALDWNRSDPPIIEIPHFMRAIQITETWRASVHRAIENIEKSTHEQLSVRITTLLSKDVTSGVTFRDICRGMRDIQPQEINKALDGMLSAGDIVRMPKLSGQKGGRSTEVYKLI